RGARSRRRAAFLTTTSGTRSKPKLTKTLVRVGGEAVEPSAGNGGNSQMTEGRKQSANAWSAAKAALHSGGSVSQLLALYDAGAVTSQEVLSAVYEYCYDKPTVAAELVEVFRRHPDEYLPWAVGDALENLMRARASGSS